MRTASRALLGLCLTAGAVLGSAVPALAAATGTATVKPAAEAWYRVTPACALPTGCADLSAAPSPYPADTLHIGVNAGAEEARTYLQLDLAPLPNGTRPSGGTLLLPVGTAEDGSRMPETATLRACAVTVAIDDADGSFAAPPAPDCEAASVPAAFVPAEGEAPAAFTVDLAALTAAWEDGAFPGALALVPVAETAPPDSWHVALSGRGRTGEGVTLISAAIAFVSALDTSTAPPPVVPPPPFEPAPTFDSGSTDLEFSTGSTTSEPPLTVAAPMLPAPSAQVAPAPVQAPVQQVVPVASFVQSGFRYPAVFLLPLLLALGAAWIGRALTQDLAGTRP